ncbi:hypothetical protein NESM_000294700 [Novymonas esmeraldas]|uniref:Uncharacterized protein n=1 Tax=Novymonas esmeraldas TaxID=1808958 RepID=A0AAW0F6S6_9TRYP
MRASASAAPLASPHVRDGSDDGRTRSGRCEAETEATTAPPTHPSFRRRSPPKTHAVPLAHTLLAAPNAQGGECVAAIVSPRLLCALGARPSVFEVVCPGTSSVDTAAAAAEVAATPLGESCVDEARPARRRRDRYGKLDVLSPRRSGCTTANASAAALDRSTSQHSCGNSASLAALSRARSCEGSAAMAAATAHGRCVSACASADSVCGISVVTAATPTHGGSISPLPARSSRLRTASTRDVVNGGDSPLSCAMQSAAIPVGHATDFHASAPLHLAAHFAVSPVRTRLAPLQTSGPRGAAASVRGCSSRDDTYTGRHMTGAMRQRAWARTERAVSVPPWCSPLSPLADARVEAARETALLRAAGVLCDTGPCGSSRSGGVSDSRRLCCGIE